MKSYKELEKKGLKPMGLFKGGGGFKKRRGSENLQRFVKERTQTIGFFLAAPLLLFRHQYYRVNLEIPTSIIDVFTFLLPQGSIFWEGGGHNF